MSAPVGLIKQTEWVKTPSSNKNAWEEVKMIREEEDLSSDSYITQKSSGNISNYLYAESKEELVLPAFNTN